MDRAKWTCSVCEKVNIAEDNFCKVCGFPRKPETKEKNMSEQWCCPRCEVLNPMTINNCAVCDLAREVWPEEKMIDLRGEKWCCPRCEALNPEQLGVCMVCKLAKAIPTGGGTGTTTNNHGGKTDSGTKIIYNVHSVGTGTTSSTSSAAKVVEKAPSIPRCRKCKKNPQMSGYIYCESCYNSILAEEKKRENKEQKDIWGIVGLIFFGIPIICLIIANIIKSLN